MFFDAHRKWRHAEVTDRRANGDFTHCVRDLLGLLRSYRPFGLKGQCRQPSFCRQ
jgi:hypothetical protein